MIVRYVIAFSLLFVLASSDDARAHYTMDTTAYCLHGTMADGTYTRPRSAASNIHPLGTRIRLVGPSGPRGMRRYVVRDRIGWGTSLDLWVPSCGMATYFGRRVRSYKLGWGRP